MKAQGGWEGKWDLAPVISMEAHTTRPVKTHGGDDEGFTLNKHFSTHMFAVSEPNPALWRMVLNLATVCV